MGFLIPLCVPLLLLMMNGGLITGQTVTQELTTDIETTIETPTPDFTTLPQEFTTGIIETTAAVPMYDYDPCSNYTSLDQPWRSSDAAGSGFCDNYYNWNGWYRLFHYGMDTRMSESCVPASRCGTYYTMWLNGPHPEIEDGVVTRQVCGNSGYDCCYFSSTQIRVKACPGNYYVYELVRPYYCSAAYCTGIVFILLLLGIYFSNTLNNKNVDPFKNIILSLQMLLHHIQLLLQQCPMVQNFPFPQTVDCICIFTASTPDISAADPCSNYNVLDDIWRTTFSYYGYGYYTYGYSWYYGSHDDTSIEWNGWYRIYLQGVDAQIPEWCVYYMTSGGYTPLLLGGSHPLIEDGIVTREIYGSYSYGYYSGQCNYYRSNPIQVKACPGHYYVYKLVKPDVSIPLPVYPAVALNSPSYDPCNYYTSLDRPWRASNEVGLGICDRNFNWNGWYRLFYHGMNIRMAETCVNVSRCGTYYTLWLNGPHPQIEDGVVTRQVCGNEGNDCCYFKSTPIRVKACPGNYHVYELVSPMTCNMAYCTVTSQTNFEFDPCDNYNALDEYWRSIGSYYSYGHDDTTVEWNDWYRLYLYGASAQLPEWCVSYVTCGGYTPLSLGGSHPQPEDGIVTRDVYGSNGTHCTAYTSKPIQVKACPGDYYVYKLVRPDVAMPMPSYCAGRGSL
ncbi:hypothetical protein NFI96_032154 [Prochilodus magdalenae]|nr:hypothetical protein NFI96_032154 [Prochilodus magdalenae]